MLTVNSNFPIWLLMYISPWLIANLLFNYVIDTSLIIVLLKMHNKKLRKDILVRTVSMAWIMGFVSDILGVIILLLIHMRIKVVNVFNPFDSGVTLSVFLAVILICGALVYMNDKYLLERVGVKREVAVKVAAVMGIITCPWFFLIPSIL